MDKTKVDDILIEMISPKIKEIEEKFSSGGALTQDDINTLLLKAQYNHINHLDKKLNEVTESVVNLEHKFEKLEDRFDSTVKELRNDYEKLENRLTSDFRSLEQRVTNDIRSLEQRMEVTIQKALNRNMMMLIIVIGAFLTLSKIIDKF